MKRKLAFSTAVLALFAVAFVALQATAAPKAARTIKHRGGAITIERWLHATPNSNMAALTTMGCFKISGALRDQGGKPTWTADTFATNELATSQCGNEEPFGGGLIAPPPAGAPYYSVYAVQTLTGKRGQIFITMAGDYNIGGPVPSGLGGMAGSGTWTITGGTGAYEGVQGNGTWTADLLAMGQGYCRHLETGQVWWSR